MEKFQVLLNCVDHYQAVPTSFDPQLPVNAGPVPKNERPKVPVIRVFGTTETGQKVCAHVHGAFPYLYIEYQGSLNPKEGERRVLKKLINYKQIMEVFLICPSKHCHSHASIVCRSRPGDKLSPKCIRKENGVCCPHHLRKGHSLLRVSRWIQVLF